MADLRMWLANAGPKSLEVVSDEEYTRVLRRAGSPPWLSVKAFAARQQYKTTSTPCPGPTP